jgi:hypothetical protein
MLEVLGQFRIIVESIRDHDERRRTGAPDRALSER